MEMKFDVEKSALVSPDILPTRTKDRVVSGIGFLWIWVGMTVIIATFTIGAAGLAAGLPLPLTALAIFVANLLIAIIAVFNSDMGTEHGICFPVYLRAPFGIFGTHIPSVLRGIVGSAWFGIQTYLGAAALNIITSRVFGFDNFFVLFALFAIVQLVNTALGIKAVERFATFAAPTVIVISIWLAFNMSAEASQSVNIMTYVPGDLNIAAFWAVMIANISFWSALGADVSNITRNVKVNKGTFSFWSRNKNAIWPQLVAIPTVQTLMGVIGAVAFIAIGHSNPIDILAESVTGFMVVILMLMVIFAQWSTNTAANLIPPALSFANAGSPYITYKLGVLLAGIVGVAIRPWEVLDIIYTFINLYGALLGPIAGIMIADYYIIRRRRLNVPELYKMSGQYRYWNGFNPAGIIALVVAGVTAFIFFNYAYFIGFPLGFVVYLLLAKQWLHKNWPQAELDGGENEFLATSIGKEWVGILHEHEHLDVKQDVS